MNRNSFNRFALMCARLLFGLFFLLTSSYCLLAFIPFTYQWVIKCALITWLPVFVKLHPFLYWIVMALAVATFLPELRRAQTKRLALGFILFHSAAGVALVIHPLLSHLSNDASSLRWSLISLFPLIWLAAIDYASHRSENRSFKPIDPNDLAMGSFLVPAIFISILYLCIFYLRFAGQDASRFKGSELFVAAIWSLASNLLLFTFAFFVMKLTRSLAARFSRSAEVEFALCNLLAAIAFTLIVREMILPALSFNGRLADFFSIAVALTIVAFLSGLSLRLRETETESGLRLLLMPLLLLMPRSRLAQALWVALIIAVAYIIPASIATMDWDFLIQKLAAIGVWIISFTFAYSAQSRSESAKRSATALLAITIASAGLYGSLQATAALLPALLNDEQLDIKATLDRYANYDVSFKVASNILRPDLKLFASTKAEANIDDKPSARSETFYTFLQQNTDIKSPVRAVDINLVEKLARSEAELPNVFVFVIDSLRQDYLSPYNKAVNFTPNIESFARESLTMKNAFTRYGGTVLAEPSIWSGAMQLHKQYIEPFYPMNALQKLIEAEQYESFITMDPVLKLIMKESPEITELDKGLVWFQYDLCGTLKEIEQKIDGRQQNGRPLFVYTQPQNLHRMALTKRGEAVPPGESYPGFYEHYASQLQRLDGCFGEFVNYLKSRKLYDDSIIILTSDHGDSLNEEGRWGHNYWMFPEIIRIPLIIHLPAKLQKSMVWDTKAVTFSTDITPSLYYLLGQRPIVRNGIFGKPLFTLTQKEQAEYAQDSYLVASSYGAVYGILGDNGRSLFIADGVNEKDYYFDITGDPKATRNRLTTDIQAQRQRLIRERVQEINRFYNFDQ